jgi:hypothetical protein
LWGAPLLWAALYFGRLKLTLPDDPLASGTFIAVLSIVATWTAVFSFRLVTAPSRLFWAERHYAETLARQLDATKNRLANTLVVAGGVYADTINHNYKQLEWHLDIEK